MIFACLGFSCGTRSDQSTPLVDSSKVADRPDSEVGTATIYLYTKGTMTTEIKAERIRKFEKIDSTMAYSVTAVFRDTLGNVSSTLVGDSGVIRELTNRLEMFGHVHINVGDTTKLDTDFLKWNASDEKIETESFVRITRKKDVLTGYGLEATRNLSRIKIKRGVSGTVENLEGIDTL